MTYIYLYMSDDFLSIYHQIQSLTFLIKQSKGVDSQLQKLRVRNPVADELYVQLKTPVKKGKIAKDSQFQLQKSTTILSLGKTQPLPKI